jgi:UDP-N-acetylglucosamine 4-epimerase
MYSTPFHTQDIGRKSFLITGGSGFIGSNLVEYLVTFGAGKIRVLDNLATSSLDNLNRFLEAGKIEFMEGDIRDTEMCKKACEGMDYLLHQAAMGSVPRSIKDPLTTHAVNSTGFVNMLIAARDAGVKRIVYASSSSVYGDSAALPKREAETGNPLSPYAVSKKTNELYARVFASAYGMEIIGLRYFNVFGPNQSPDGPYAAVLPLFMHSLINNKRAAIDGDGEQTRDFTFIENAVEANIRALFAEDKNALGQVFNVAVGERISINMLYRILCELTSSTLQPIYREARAGDIRDSLADISRAQMLLGYAPRVRIREGLERTLQWFQQSVYAGKVN